MRSIYHVLKMAINTYVSRIESKRLSKQAGQKQKHRYREHFDGSQMGGGFREMDKEVRGLRSINW